MSEDSKQADQTEALVYCGTPFDRYDEKGRMVIEVERSPDMWIGGFVSPAGKALVTIGSVFAIPLERMVHTADHVVKEAGEREDRRFVRGQVAALRRELLDEVTDGWGALDERIAKLERQSAEAIVGDGDQATIDRIDALQRHSFEGLRSARRYCVHRPRLQHGARQPAPVPNGLAAWPRRGCIFGLSEMSNNTASSKGEIRSGFARSNTYSENRDFPVREGQYLTCSGEFGRRGGTSMFIRVGLVVFDRYARALDGGLHPLPFLAERSLTSKLSRRQ